MGKCRTFYSGQNSFIIHIFFTVKADGVAWIIVVMCELASNLHGEFRRLAHGNMHVKMTLTDAFPMMVKQIEHIPFLIAQVEGVPDKKKV
jgi:hypothetical protein